MLFGKLSDNQNIRDALALGRETVFSIFQSRTLTLKGRSRSIELWRSNSDSDKISSMVNDGLNIMATTPTSDLAGKSIFDSAVTGDVQSLSQKLNDEAVDACDQFGDTLLHLASRVGHHEVVAMLIGRGAQVNVTNLFNSTPLHDAVYGNQIEVIELLLNVGANVNVQDDNGNTPLYLACKNFDEEIVKLLLDHKANPNIPNKAGKMPLHSAVCYNNAASISLLVSHGASVDTKNNYGDSPLHTAAEVGRASVLKQLIRNGADYLATNDVGRNALHTAAELCPEFSSLKEVTSALLNAGVDLGAKDLSDVTVLEIIKNKYDNDTYNDYLEYCNHHIKSAQTAKH